MQVALGFRWLVSAQGLVQERVRRQKESRFKYRPGPKRLSLTTAKGGGKLHSSACKGQENGERSAKLLKREI